MEQWSVDDRKFAKELFFGWPGDFKPFVLGLINRARALRDAERESEFAALRAENARLREALERIKRAPVKPFPDPSAHSWRVFGEAVFSAWRSDKRTARAALGGENDTST